MTTIWMVLAGMLLCAAASMRFAGEAGTVAVAEAGAADAGDEPADPAEGGEAGGGEADEGLETELGRGYDEQKASERTTKPDEKAEGEKKPAEQPAQDPQAGQTFTAEQLNGYREQLVAYKQQIDEITQSTAFQAGYKAFMQAQQGQPAGTDQGGAQKPQEQADGQAKPDQGFDLDSIEVETETEQKLLDGLKWMQKQWADGSKSYQDKIQTLESKLAQHDADLNSRMSSQAEETLRTALEPIKKEFPDLVDGGKNEDKLLGWAANFMDVAQKNGEPMTVSESLEAAAHHLGYGSVSERERVKLQEKARQATGARVDTPGQGAASAGGSLDEALASGYDEIAASS